MTAPVLIDTGPLVAIFLRTEQHHEICVEQLRTVKPPLLTCWPVITEAAWLLRRSRTAIQQLLGAFNSGLLRLLSLEQDAVPWIAAFLHKYRSLGPDLADAALVYLAERDGIDTVFTLDRRDFSVYRLAGNRRLELLP